MKYISVLVALFLPYITSSYTYVDELNLEEYDGTWYEVYKDILDETFQKGGSCVKAEYTLLNNNTRVGVVNTEILPNGTYDSIEGYAFYEEDNEGGELTVYLEGAPTLAPYWVIELGPIFNDKYDYAIVSDDKQITLFVLARDIDRFFKLYDDNVLQSLEDFGFTSKYNKPKKVNQTYCS